MLTGISTLFHPQIKSCPLHAEMVRAPAPAAVEGSDWLARPPRTLFWRTHLKPRRHEEDEGTVPGALGDIAPVQGTHSWGRWRRHSKKEASRKRARKECSPAFPAARGAVWRCSRQGASVPTVARRADSTDSTQMETAPEAQAEERKVQDSWCPAQGVGLCSTVARSCRATVPAHWSRVGHLLGHRGSPHTPRAAPAGLTPGSCYLCTMSLISFTELRSLLKS